MTAVSGFLGPRCLPGEQDSRAAPLSLPDQSLASAERSALGHRLAVVFRITLGDLVQRATPVLGASQVDSAIDAVLPARATGVVDLGPDLGPVVTERLVIGPGVPKLVDGSGYDVLFVLAWK